MPICLYKIDFFSYYCHMFLDLCYDLIREIFEFHGLYKFNIPDSVCKSLSLCCDKYLDDLSSRKDWIFMVKNLSLYNYKKIMEEIHISFCIIIVGGSACIGCKIYTKNTFRNLGYSFVGCDNLCMKCFKKNIYIRTCKHCKLRRIINGKKIECFPDKDVSDICDQCKQIVWMKYAFNNQSEKKYYKCPKNDYIYEYY